MLKVLHRISPRCYNKLRQLGFIVTENLDKQAHSCAFPAKFTLNPIEISGPALSPSQTTHEGTISGGLGGGEGGIDVKKSPLETFELDTRIGIQKCILTVVINVIN